MELAHNYEYLPAEHIRIMGAKYASSPGVDAFLPGSSLSEMYLSNAFFDFSFLLMAPPPLA